LSVIQPRRSSGIRIAAILIGVITVLYLAREILIPLAFAITLTFVLAPAVSWLQKLHISRFPAVLLVMLVSIAAAGGIGYVIFNQLVQVVNDLPSYRENIDNKIKALRAPNKGPLGRAAQSVKELGKELATAQELPPPPVSQGRTGRLNTPVNTPANPLPVQVVEAPPNGLVYVRDLTAPFIAPLAILGIVLVFTVFLLVEEADLRNRLFRLAGLNRLNVMTQALDDATRRVSRYLMLQFMVNAGFGILCGVGLYLIGVPYAALWGTVAALLRIVPYVGSVSAGLLPLLLSLAVFDGWLRPLLVFLLFTTLELVIANLLEPLLYGAHTGISSLALLVTTVFWTTIWGPAGLILSTPLTVCVVVLGRHIPHLSFLHILLGDQPVLAPDAHLYQRLLAMDEQEARAVAEEYRSENSLLQLYDAVILPALALAEQDRHKGALDPEREEFLFLSVREMLAEFSEKAENSAAEYAQDRPVQAVPGRILCFPAHDEADEIAAAVLAQLLEQAGCATVTFPLGSSPDSMLVHLEPTASDVFCISAIPPFAFSHARTINRQLRAKFPETRVVIGIWGFTGEVERALQRFRPSPPDKFASSLADALEYLGVRAPEAKVEEVPA
jgi:predicted PurR-regulated permease PerM